MMPVKLKYLPIKLRLMIIIMMASIAVLAISTGVTIYHDTYRLKQQMVQETKMVNQVLAQDFAKVSLFGAPEVAADTISRISSFPMILYVDVYNISGDNILHYSVDSKKINLNKPSSNINFFFTEERLILETPIIYQNRLLGSAYYEISIAKIEQRLQDIYQLLLYSVPGSLIFSILFAFYLQGVFSRPINKLTKAVENLADQEDFKQRLQISSLDKSEIGILQAGFNKLLIRLQYSNDAIKDQKENIHIMLDSIGDAVIATNIKSEITLMNPVASKLTGWSLKDALGKPLEEVFHIINSKTRKIVDNPVSKVLRLGQIVRLSNHTSLVTRGGFEHQIMDSAAPIFDENQSIRGVVLVFHDVSESYRTLQKIEESEIRFKLMANASHTIIWQTDAQGQCIFVNETMQEFTGLSVNELTYNWQKFIHPDDLELIYSSFYCDIPSAHKERIEIEYRLLNHSGEYRFIYDIGTPLINNKKQFIGYIGSGIDITEKKQTEKQINHLAYYDSLTGLPNRRLFIDRFKQVLIRVKRYNLHGAVLFIDLDHFKTLNDSLGHSAGDLLLKEVAKRLCLIMREEDTVARLGGDEFIVLSGTLEISDNEIIHHIQTLAKKILDRLRKPYLLGSYEHINTLSIGVSLFSGLTSDIEECIKRADTAMYIAKSKGRNGYCFYSPTMQQAVDRRLDLEKQLRIAIIEQQFSLYYQPKVSMEGNIIGAEALIRWIKPDGQMISPDIFIPVAEETGLIIDIGDWVLQTAISQLGKWERLNLTENFQLAINVSPRQFHQDNFVDRVSSLYLSNKIMSRQVTLEITEGVIVEYLDETISVMNELRRNGFKIALDDFGTGYSSLSYLKNMPLDEIKIDRSFMQGIPDNTSDVTIIKTICMVAESFNLKTVAEGVEEQIQLEFLAKINCDCYQGYLFSPPVNAEKFTKCLRINKGHF